MFRVWITMRRYQKSGKNNDGVYLQFLQFTVSSSGQWGGFILIIWSLHSSILILNVCRELQYVFVRDRFNTLFSTISDLGMAANGALLAVLLLYMLRWYALNKIRSFSLQSNAA